MSEISLAVGDRMRRMTYAELASPPSDATPDTTRAICVLEAAVEALREQLTIGNERADRERERADTAERRADRERDRADSVAQQLTGVETELVAARVEAAGLRCKLAKAADTQPAPGLSRWRRVFGMLERLWPEQEERPGNHPEQREPGHVHAHKYVVAVYLIVTAMVGFGVIQF